MTMHWWKIVCATFVVFQVTTGVQLKSFETLETFDSLNQETFNGCSSSLLSVATKCLNEKAVIPSRYAYSQAMSLADFFDNMYVFVDIAKDPSKPKIQGNSVGWEVFTGKTLLVQGLKTLATKYDAESDESVPLLPLVQQINVLFGSLRDAHVDPWGSKKFGPPLPLEAFSVALAYSTGPTSASKVSIEAVKSEESETPDLMFNGTKIVSIDGTAPMDWLVENLADSTHCTEQVYGLKGLGNRVNRYLYKAKSDGLGTCGLLYTGDTSKYNDKIEVQLEGQETPMTWVWSVIGMQDNFEIVPSALYSALNESLAMVENLISPKAKKNFYNFLETSDGEEDDPNTATTITPEQAFENWWSSNAAFACDGEKGFCSIKVQSFHPPDQSMFENKYVEEFNNLVDKANELGVTKLIVDVSSNFGGLIPLGMLMSKSFFPQATRDQICPTFYQKASEADKWVYRKRLFGTKLDKMVTKQYTHQDWNKRAKMFTKRRCALLKSQTEALKRIWTAVFTLFDASPMYKQGLSKDAFVQLFNQMQSLSDSCSLDGATLRQIVDFFQGTWSQSLENSAFPDLAQSKRFNFGGKKVLYGRGRDDLCYTASAAEALKPSPFKDVIIVSDGSCGSTCGFMTVSAKAYFAKYGQDVRIFTAGFGGTGQSPEKQSFSVCAFQGGNVVDVDLYTIYWLVYAAAASVKRLAGFTYLSQVDDFGSRIPRYPLLNTRSPPSYVFRGSISDSLGPNSIFTEYYIVKPDIFVQDWFYLYGLNGDDLPKLYDKLLANLQ